MSRVRKGVFLSAARESQKATHHRICRNTSGGKRRVKLRLKIVKVYLDPNPLNTRIPPPPPTCWNFQNAGILHRQVVQMFSGESAQPRREALQIKTTSPGHTDLTKTIS